MEEEEEWNEGLQHSEMQQNFEGNPNSYCWEKPSNQPAISVFAGLHIKAEPVILRSAVILQDYFLSLSRNKLSHAVSSILVSAS